MSDGEQPQVNPGVLLAQRMVEEMVLMREALTKQREATVEQTAVMDTVTGYFEVIDRVVELMAESNQKPNWDLFLRAWEQASEEVFDGDDDDEGGGDGPPEAAPKRPAPGGFRRKPFVTQG